MNGRYVADPDDRPTYPVVKAEFGEDPARYLALDDLYLAFARIRGIDNLALLKEWQRIESEHWGRSRVMQRLNARERELTGEEISPDPQTTEPTIADGGTVETPDDSDISADDVASTADSETATSNPASTSESATDPTDPLHPDVKGLDAGEVLVLEFPDATEYIFPGTPAADAPYLMRTADDEMPTGLSFDAVLARIDGSPDPQPIGEIDVKPPADAATNGGAE